MIFGAQYIGHRVCDHGGNHFEFEDEVGVDAHCRALGSTLKITIEAEDGGRSEGQHGLLRTWNRIFAREIGLTEEEMLTEFFKQMGYGESRQITNIFTGEIEERFKRRSTKSLTWDEAESLLSFMDRKWSETFDGVLPKRERLS